jgi:asparagine synthase (glutamine-hydrolysing)
MPPFGVLLSGGIDSSAIAALVRRHASGPVRTFTVGFSDFTALNELDEARAIAHHFGTEHHEVRVDGASMREYLPQLVVTQDEPIADWVCVPLYFVSKLVRESGTIVTLVGEGADEEFCGYRSYMGYLQLHDRYWARWMRAPRPLKRLAAAAAAGLGAMRPELALYADIPQRAAEGREMFWGGAVAFWESQKELLISALAPPTGPPPDWLGSMLPPAFLDGNSHDVVRHHLAALERIAPDADLLARMTYLEFKQRLPELLLMRVDKITMSTSVEARVPFLDPSIVSYTMSLPRALKVPGGRRKDLLKAACRGLIPDEVIDREKRGFGAPMVEWLRDDFGREAESVILGSRLVRERLLDADRIRLLFARHRRGHDTSVPLWTLYNLAAWHNRWLA